MTFASEITSFWLFGKGNDRVDDGDKFLSFFRFLILLISAIIFKQRKLRENEVTQSFLEAELISSLLGEFWKIIIKIKQTTTKI